MLVGLPLNNKNGLNWAKIAYKNFFAVAGSLNKISAETSAGARSWPA